MQKLAFWLSLLLVFTIPWETVIESPAWGSASRVAGLALAASWAVAVMKAGRVRQPGLFHLALCVFAALNAVSILWTSNIDATTTQMFTWLQLVVLSFLLWDLYTTRTDIFAALQMYVLGGYVVVGNILANYVMGKAFYYDRFSAAGSHPDDVGVILALGLPAAAYLAAFRPQDRLNGVLKAVNCLYFVAAYAGIALSGTRTALVVAVPGTLFGLAVFARQRGTVKLAVAVLLIAAGVVITPWIPGASFERFATIRGEVLQGDLNGRLALWGEGLASFEAHPFLGVGSNMFRSTNVEAKVAHNSFISVLVELGIAGFSLFVIIVMTAGISALRQRSWDRTFWLAVFAGWAIGASMLTWEFKKPTWLFLSLMIASAAAARSSGHAPASVPEALQGSAPGRPPAFPIPGLEVSK